MESALCTLQTSNSALFMGFAKGTMSFFLTLVVGQILTHQENVSVSIWYLTRCTDGVKKQVEVVNHL